MRNDPIDGIFLRRSINLTYDAGAQPVIISLLLRGPYNYDEFYNLHAPLNQSSEQEMVETVASIAVSTKSYMRQVSRSNAAVVDEVTFRGMSRLYVTSYSV